MTAKANAAKIVINREHLLPSLQQAVNITEKKQPIPILQNVLLAVNNGGLAITGTDTEIQLVSRAEIINGTEGTAITVPARKLLDFCRLLPQKTDITLTLGETHVTVKTARSRCTINAMPAEHYPEFSLTKMANHFTITNKELKKAFEQTLWCMAKMDVRYFLMGTFLALENDTIKLIASDSYRLALHEYKLAMPSEQKGSIIIPRKAVLELCRLLDDSDTLVAVDFGKNNLKVTLPTIEFSAKLIGAKYPVFERVFATPLNDPITVPKEGFKEALARVAVLANPDCKVVTLFFFSDKLTILARNPSGEDAEEALEINYAGEELEINFNAHYLLEAAAHIKGKNMLLTFAEGSSFCLIEEPEPSEYRFTVMPIKN